MVRYRSSRSTDCELDRNPAYGNLTLRLTTQVDWFLDTFRGRGNWKSRGTVCPTPLLEKNDNCWEDSATSKLAKNRKRPGKATSRWKANLRIGACRWPRPLWWVHVWPQAFTEDFRVRCDDLQVDWWLDSIFVSTHLFYGIICKTRNLDGSLWPTPILAIINGVQQHWRNTELCRVAISTFPHQIRAIMRPLPFFTSRAHLTSWRLSSGNPSTFTSLHHEHVFLGVVHGATKLDQY